VFQIPEQSLRAAWTQLVLHFSLTTTAQKVNIYAQIRMPQRYSLGLYCIDKYDFVVQLSKYHMQTVMTISLPVHEDHKLVHGLQISLASYLIEKRWNIESQKSRNVSMAVLFRARRTGVDGALPLLRLSFGKADPVDFMIGSPTQNCPTVPGELLAYIHKPKSVYNPEMLFGGLSTRGLPTGGSAGKSGHECFGMRH
jgi:hypothetical protein